MKREKKNDEMYAHRTTTKPQTQTQNNDDDDDEVSQTSQVSGQAVNRRVRRA